MTSKKFSWLHLSDLHIGQSSQWLWKNFKAIFLEDLRRISGEAGPIDLVLFSGDLTQNGSKDQYSTLTGELQEIWEMWDKLGQRPSLFTVPGNHDLQRPAAKDARMKMLTRWSDEPDVVQEFWNEKDNQYIELVRTAFSNYINWQDEITSSGIPMLPLIRGLLPGDASASLELNGISVGLVGLNSSFLQLDGSDFLGKLALDLRQLNAVTEGDPPRWCNQHEINFLITHHPTSWLSTDVARDFHTEIFPSGRFTAHLFGHMHDPDLLTQYRGGDAGRKSFQSSSLFGMEFLGDGTTERVHGYSVGQILFDETEVTWKLWPRKGKVNRKNGDRKIIPDHDNFDIVPGHEYQSEQLIKRTPSSISVVMAAPPVPDLASAVEENVFHWNNALQSAIYLLSEADQHVPIRPLQQQACVESVRQTKVAWICADWGLGRDGFIWSVIKRMGREKQPVYRVGLRNYSSRTEFFSAFSTMVGCSFPEFCKALAAVGPAILLFDEAPVSIGNQISSSIERDVENLAKMVRDFCPDIAVLLLARTIPRQHEINVVLLDPLDEADTKSYLMAHPGVSSELISPYGVNTIYRRTDGLPGKIESVLKTLRVISLSELGLTSSIQQADVITTHETIPSTLVRAVTDLAESEDPLSKRSFLLLKVLSILPHGESLLRLKRIDHRFPIWPAHAEELLDRDLIQVRFSTALIGMEGEQENRMKILVAPRPVRDYVLSQMSSREIDALVRKAISLYFGERWATGSASLQKLGGALTSDDGSLLENPHSLVLRLLEQASIWDMPDSSSAILNLCKIYCNALLSGKHYRNCSTVCKDILRVVPETGFSSYRNAFEVMLAKALRMSGEDLEARVLLERLLQMAWPKKNRINILLVYALCLQSLNDIHALAVANEIISFDPKSSAGLQAKAIILEMQENADNSDKLLAIELEARKLGFNTVANNLTLGRVAEVNDAVTRSSLLQEVYSTSIKGGDPYTAARGMVKLCALTLKETGTLPSGDLNKLIDAYQYFYGQRSDSLFLNSHRTLWNYFESQADIRNLLSLFRHSSFIWRLNGKEEIEQVYIKKLVSSARQILSTNILTADKNTGYFLIRASNAAS